VNPDNDGLVVFRVGDVLCGLGIEHIHEVSRKSDITRVPGAPPEVRGVINLRGQIVTVLDPAAKLGVTAVERSRGRKIVVVQFEDELIGLLVDEVEDIVHVPPGSFLDAPAQHHDSVGRCIVRVCELEEGLVSILDLEELVS